MNALVGLLILTGLIYGILIDGTFWKIYAALVAVYTAFVLFQRDSKENPKRKTLLIATWNQPSDPTSYIINDYCMDKAIAYVKKLNEDQKDIHITMTHLMTLGVAQGLYKMRRDVGRLPFGTFKASKRLGVTVLVDVEGGKDLVPVTLFDVHKMNIFELAQKISERVQRAKKGKDTAHNQSTALANFIPSFIAQPIGYCLTYVAAAVGISIPALSIRNETFGHVTLTNVGTMGYTSGYAPLCPPMHQLALICTGKIEKRAVVDTDDNDKVVIKSMMTSVATGDHRYGDAAVYLPFFRCLRGFIDDPENFDESKYKENAHYSEAKSK